MGKYTCIPTRPDGNCLFHALGKGLDICGFKLRQDMIQYISTHYQDMEITDQPVEDWIKLAGYQTVEKYMNTMKRPTTHGSALEIAIVNKMYSRKIVVKGSDGKTIAKYNGKRPTIYIHWSGNHYDYLEKQPKEYIVYKCHKCNKSIVSSKTITKCTRCGNKL